MKNILFFIILLFYSLENYSQINRDTIQRKLDIKGIYSKDLVIQSSSDSDNIVLYANPLRIYRSGAILQFIPPRIVKYDNNLNLKFDITFKPNEISNNVRYLLSYLKNKPFKTYIPLYSEEFVWKGSNNYFIAYENDPDKMGLTQVNIIKVNDDGKYSRNTSTLLVVLHGIVGSFIGENGLLNTIGYTINSKKKTAKYYLIQYDKYLNSNFKSLELEGELTEIDSEVYPNFHQYQWKKLATLNDKLLLIRNYATGDDAERGKKQKEAINNEIVCKTVEVSFDGNITNLKEFNLRYNLELNKETVFYFRDNFYFNKTRNELSFIGMKKSEKKVNGFYFFKYNYESASNICSRVYDFNDLNNQLFEGKKILWISNAPVFRSFGYVYYIDSDEIIFDEANNIISVKIMERDDGNMDFKKHKNEFILDDFKGDVLKINELKGYNPYHFKGRKHPYSVKNIWENKELLQLKRSTEKQELNSYINGYYEIEKPKKYSWFIIENNKSGSKLLSYDFKSKILTLFK